MLLVSLVAPPGTYAHPGAQGDTIRLVMVARTMTWFVTCHTRVWGGCYQQLMANREQVYGHASKDDALLCITMDCGDYWFSVVSCCRQHARGAIKTFLIMKDGIDMYKSVF